MNAWAIPKRAFMGALYGIGLGFFAGGIEMVALAASQSLSIGFLPFTLLGGVDALLMGGLGFVAGLLTAPLHLVFHKARPSTAIAVHLTAIGFLLCGYYLWQAAFLIYTDERAPAAYAMAAIPLGFTGVIYFNARFLLRRMERGTPFAAPWLPTAFAAAMSIVLLAGTFQGLRDTGGRHALQDDRNVVFVTVDTGSEIRPELEERFTDSIVFENAITPTPHVRSAAASLLTGLHPLRNRTLFDDGVLPWHYSTLAEVLAAEGYATGAFVSTDSLGAESGLSQGFKVYDDDFSPVVPGLLRLNLMKNLLGGRGWERPGATTTRHFIRWLATKADYPFFAWIQLPAEGADVQMLQILDALEPLSDETFLVFTATSGVPTRTDGSLYDDRIRVPMILRLPGVERKNPRVMQQVRLFDLPTTATTWLGVKAPDNEGIDLSGFAAGTRNRTIGSSLLARSPDGTVQLGLRNNGVKFITTMGQDQGELYWFADDPGEQTNLAKEQPKAYEQANAILAPDVVRLEKLLR